jgi:hypothetical protein
MLTSREHSPVADVRHRFDAYREAIEREFYNFRSGRKPTLDLDGVDERFGDVTTGELLAEAESAAQSGFTEDMREGSRRLGVGIRSAMVDREVRPISREVSEREAAKRIRVDGEERSLYAWQSALGSEPDLERRRRIQIAKEAAWSELNPLREELHVRRSEILAGQGFASLRAWAEAKHPGVDYSRWLAHADALLERTEGAYRDAVSKGLAGIGVDPRSAHPGDTARLFRMEPFDSVFPPERLLESLDFTTESMGIRLDEAPGVVVDGEARPTKHPRACCIAPRIPGEVFVLFYPRGGVQDYEALFHEAGHALHVAFTSAELPVERRRVFDPALTETWAFLLHYRIADPAWVEETPAKDRAGVLLPRIRLEKLFLLRRYAAKLRFESELCEQPAGESPRPFAARYAEELGRATGLHYAEAGYLADTDPDLYCADYLRAWCLEARLAEWLRERFGRRFWRARRAGDLLKELWNTGETYTADGLSDQLGLGPIDPEALIEECLHGSAEG